MLNLSKSSAVSCALVLGFSLFAASNVSLGASQDLLVSDPDTLEAMGFERDAKNVYMAPGVDLEGAFTDRFSAADLEAQASGAALQVGVGFSPVSAKEFIGRLDTTGTQWRYAGGPNCCVDLSRVGTESFADAQVTDLPNGGTLDFIRAWWFDNVAQDITVFLFENCQPGFAAGPITITTIATLTAAGTPGNVTQLGILNNRPINIQDCHYLARVRFDGASTNLALQKVRLQFTHP